MDLRQIQFFVKLFQEGSMTRAAARLNVVQPALSMQIRRLEDEFGVRLFERTSRGVIPTDTGKSFYRMCLEILADVEKAGRYLREATGRIEGELRVGLMPSLARNVAPRVISEYSSLYPGVRLRVLDAYSGNLVDWLASGDIDFAVINRPEKDVGVSTIPLFNDSLLLISGTDDNRVAPASVWARQLASMHLILPSERQGMRRLIDTTLARFDIRLVPEMEMDSLQATMELVRGSRWATILPGIAIRQADIDESIEVRRIIAPVISREVVVGFHPQHPLTMAGRLFVDKLAEHSRSILEAPPNSPAPF